MTMVCSVQYRAVRESADDAFYELSNPREQIQAYVFDGEERSEDDHPKLKFLMEGLLTLYLETNLLNRFLSARLHSRPIECWQVRRHRTKSVLFRGALRFVELFPAELEDCRRMVGISALGGSF